MLHILATSLSLYVIVRLILPLRLPLWIKLVLSLLVVLVALKLYFFRMAFGTMMPELPRWLTAATGVLHGSLILLIILSLRIARRPAACPVAGAQSSAACADAAVFQR